MVKPIKTLKTKKFETENKNKFGLVVLLASIISCENYKKFHTQATPKGQVIPIDKKFNSKIDCYPFANEWEAANQNQWTYGGWRETRTSYTPKPNDAQIAVKMLRAGSTLCELFNTDKQILGSKKI